MNIYLYELKKKIVSSIIWVGALGLFVWVCFGMIDMMANEAMTNIIDQFPDEMKHAFGMDIDLSTVSGYYAWIHGMIITLCGAIFSMNFGLNAVSTEERDLTADFLISKPITRSAILTAKLAAALTHILFFTAMMVAITLGSIELYAPDKAFSLETYFMIIGGLFLLELLFLALGLFLSVTLKRIDSPLPFSMGISIGFYMLNAFDTLLKDTILRYFIPFDYFDAAYIVENETFQTHGMVISSVLIVGMSVAGYLLYQKRNIATAM